MGQPSRLRRAALLVGLALVGSTGATTLANDAATNAQDPRAGFDNAAAAWKLSNVRVTNPGNTLDIEEGAITRQRVIEADAVTTRDGLPQKASFRLTMDVFSPAADMSMQKKDHWYVQGRWTLSPAAQDANAAKAAAVTAGALTGTVAGRVQAELDFDPVASGAAWSGDVTIPMSRVRSDGVKAGVRPLRGGGHLALAEDGQGSLAVDLKLWPRF